MSTGSAKKTVLFEEDLAVRPDYTSCVDGCDFWDEGRMIQCSHCGRWFHTGCVDAPEQTRQDWYHSEQCETAGKSIIVPTGNNYNEWNKAQLKVRLAQYDLPLSGTKKVLIQLLEEREASGLGMWGDEKMKSFDFTFHGAQGPMQFPRSFGESSLIYFSLLWGDDVWDMLVKASNNYAALSDTDRGRKQKGWRNAESLDSEELQTYFGDRLHMGLFGVQNMNDCWVAEFVDKGHVIKLYQNTFSRNRFQDITANLHVTWERKSPSNFKFDKMWKVRPLITLLESKFLLYWNPSLKISIDEMGIASKSTRIGFLQYNPKKPHKWSFKVYIY